ncbi:TerB N-terminal domain-containing protein [Duganella vulcania]|uniref:TerB N-terminal domain-containing protein n=1 Tax=Duganella vulcania TaxID=2692166 RepID=A0A845GG36_9BURK|nr:TerB N-terminal domain-containing protein [Duganella vulcania]MYM92345.1 hypothetical protein [Duganella vulcania]
MTLRPSSDHQVGAYTFRIENGRLAASANGAKLWQRRPTCIAVVTEDGERFTLLRDEHPKLVDAKKVALKDLFQLENRATRRWELWAFPAISAAAALSHTYWLALAALSPAALMTLWHRRQQSVLLFSLGAVAQARFKTMKEQLAQIKNASSIWDIGPATTQKIPGLYTLTCLEKAKHVPQVTRGLPYAISSNLEVPCLTLDGMAWYFTPHALLVEVRGNVQEIAYSRLQTRTTRVNVREEGTVPPGATITGRTWRHITKDGKQHPSQRDNHSYPVVAYVQTTIYTSDGFQASFLTLRAGTIDPLLAAISGIAPAAYAGNQGYSPPIDRQPARVPVWHSPAEPAGQADRIEPHLHDTQATCRHDEAPGASPLAAPAARKPKGARSPIYIPAGEENGGRSDVPIPPAPPSASADAHQRQRAGAPQPHFIAAHARSGQDNPPAPLWPRHDAASGSPTTAALPPNCRWIRKGESVSAGGFEIAGGLLYICVGGSLGDGPLDPAVIDITAEVHNQDVPLQDAQMGYWPSYSDISPRARRGYLQWLAGGRSAPDADIGFAFLYLYGLERRILADNGADDLDEFELADITERIAQLLGIYGGQPSFRHYAEGLRHYISALAVQGKTYLAPPPKLSRGTTTTPFPIKLALAQMAADSHPLSPQWALAWAATSPTIKFGRHVERCKREFADLFRYHFNDTYPAGIVLKPGRAALQLRYEPASAALRGRSFTPDLQNLPDVSHAPHYIDLLQQLVDRCTQALVAYSKKLLRVATPGEKAAAAYLLPFPIWPQELKRPVEQLRLSIGERTMAMTQEQLITHFLHGEPCTKADLAIIAAAAAAAGIAMEPALNTLRHGETPATVHLYRTDGTDPAPIGDSDWRHLTLGLAASLGHVKHAGVAEAVRERLESFALLHSDLPVAAQRRLRASGAAHCDQPPSTQTLVKKISVLPGEQIKDCFGYAAAIVSAAGDAALTGKLLHAMASVAMTDAEAHALLHAERYNVPAPVTPIPSGPAIGGSAPAAANAPLPADAGAQQGNGGKHEQQPSGAIVLDADRIAAIIRDTAAVNHLLAGVFQDDQPASTQAATFNRDSVQTRRPSIWGLSPTLSLLLRYLVKRPTWSRSALARHCARLGLMVDGALEAINDAAFDHLDAALTEGTDPIAIDPTLAHQVPV